MKTLVLGYGNVTRGDDGAGVYVAEEIEKANWPGVEVRTAQQLPVELVEEFKNFGRIVLVDVNPQAAHAVIQAVKESDPAPAASSHHLSPSHLLRLSVSMGYPKPELFICMVPGKQFDFNAGLSDETRAQAVVAVKKIKKLLII